MRPKKPSGVRKTRLAKQRRRSRKPTLVARSARTPKVVRARTATSAKTATTGLSGANAWALALGAAGVLAVGLLVGFPSDDRTSMALEPASDTEPIPPAGPSMPAGRVTNSPSRTFKEQAPQAPTTPPRANVTDPAMGGTAVAALVAALPAVETVPVVETTDLRHSAARVAARIEPPVEQPAHVTITGCLETDDERFRLNDTTGSDAPKSRSWKSGFLRKRPAPIDVLDASGVGVGLPRHVGERVSLTGTLGDRTMHVQSLRRVGVSCE